MAEMPAEPVIASAPVAAMLLSAASVSNADPAISATPVAASLPVAVTAADPAIDKTPEAERLASETPTNAADPVIAA
jgi:hypothetical protein